MFIWFGLNLLSHKSLHEIAVGIFSLEALSINTFTLFLLYIIIIIALHYIFQYH